MIIKNISISCDSCKVIYLYKEQSIDSLCKINNFVTISKTFEYGSHNDGDTYSCHFCESCANKILKKYWHKENIVYDDTA
jgi:hypothetical protein